jgi:hypothetical protein
MSSSPARITSGMLREGSDDRKSQLRILNDELLWDISDARKIWAFGPLSGANAGTLNTHSLTYNR